MVTSFDKKEVEDKLQLDLSDLILYMRKKSPYFKHINEDFQRKNLITKIINTNTRSCFMYPI